MKAGVLRSTIMLLTGVALFMLSACGTTAPTRFYLMSPMEDAGQGSPPAGNNGVSIALAPVELPEHLNRPQIVTRQDGHQVRVDEFNRWAEPLKVHVTEVLAENLSVLLGTEGVTITNRLKQAEDGFHLSVEILRFDGWLDKEATLVCRWHLGRGGEPVNAHPERFSAIRPLEGSEYADLVAVMSGMLADLSREIAKKIDAY